MPWLHSTLCVPYLWLASILVFLLTLVNKFWQNWCASLDRIDFSLKNFKEILVEHVIICVTGKWGCSDEEPSQTDKTGSTRMTY